jgi:hypothetical protein
MSESPAFPRLPSVDYEFRDGKWFPSGVPVLYCPNLMLAQWTERGSGDACGARAS